MLVKFMIYPLEKRKPSITKKIEIVNPKAMTVNDLESRDKYGGSSNFITNEIRANFDISNQYFPNSFRCDLSNFNTEIML